MSIARCAAALALGLVACNGADDVHDGSAPGDASCNPVASSDLDCTPSYDPPSFAAIYDNVLEKRCGDPGTGGQCHGPEETNTGLVLFDPDTAHANLVEGDRPLVVAGHPECSELMRRLESDDPRVRMPYMDEPLDDGGICAIRLWIAAGAEGP